MNSRGNLAYLDVESQCHYSGGSRYENSVTGWCTGGRGFRYRHAALPLHQRQLKLPLKIAWAAESVAAAALYDRDYDRRRYRA